MVESKRSGQTFIAYQGNEFSKDEIVNALRNACPRNYTVKTRYDEDENIVFAKIVLNTYYDDRDPHWDSISELLTVNGYNQDEMENANKVFSSYGITDPDRCHRLTHSMFQDHGTKMFKILGEHMHFCTVIWDRINSLIIAGVTTPNSEYTHLFYGYTRQNHELMFSNSEAALHLFCDQIAKMPDNTYMQNGNLHSLAGEEFEKKESTPLPQEPTPPYNEDFALGVNIPFEQITFEDYLTESETPSSGRK